MNGIVEMREAAKKAYEAYVAIRTGAEAEKREMTPAEMEKRGVLKQDLEGFSKKIEDLELEAELRQRYGGGATATNTHSPIEIEDAPIYRGSAAARLGQQLLDIRCMSRPEVFGESERRDARSRLEQTEKRNREKQEKRAASTPTMQIGVPADGGFALQGETAVDLMTAGFNNSEVLSRCSSRTLSDDIQFIDTIGIDESSRADGSRGGGVRVYTSAELAEITASSTKFSKVRIEPKKLTGLYHASSEAMRSVVFLGQEMRGLFVEEFSFKWQDLVLSGTGAGEPLGILNASALVTVSKESAQTARTINTANILKMESALHNTTSSTVYLVNRETKPQLATLSISVGTGGSAVPLYQTAYYQGTQRATLNGFPCITIEQCSALGTVGDILLVDLSQYITANKGSINEAMSMHVNFIYDQQTFRFTHYFDGQPRWTTSVRPYKGAATARVSPYIALATRG